MKCKNCGAKVHKDDAFCVKCGSRITPAKTPSSKRLLIGLIILLLICGISTGVFLAAYRQHKSLDQNAAQSTVQEDGGSETTASVSPPLDAAHQANLQQAERFRNNDYKARNASVSSFAVQYRDDVYYIDGEKNTIMVYHLESGKSDVYLDKRAYGLLVHGDSLYAMLDDGENRMLHKINIANKKDEIVSQEHPCNNMVFDVFNCFYEKHGRIYYIGFSHNSDISSTGPNKDLALCYYDITDNTCGIAATSERLDAETPFLLTVSPWVSFMEFSYDEENARWVHLYDEDGILQTTLAPEDSDTLNNLYEDDKYIVYFYEDENYDGEVIVVNSLTGEKLVKPCDASSPPAVMIADGTMFWSWPGEDVCTIEIEKLTI